MMKLYSLIFTVLVMTYSTVAQEIRLSADIGFGTYSMKEFKKLQESIMNRTNPYITSSGDFSPSLLIEAGGSVKFKKSFFVGVSVGYGSAKGHIEDRGNFGYHFSDEQLRYLNLSIPVGYSFSLGNNFELNFDISPTYTITSAKVKYEAQFQDEFETMAYRFRSGTIALQPGAMLVRRFNNFGIHLKGAYYQSVAKGNLKYNEDRSKFLQGPNGAVHAQWDGIRLAAGASFFL